MKSKTRQIMRGIAFLIMLCMVLSNGLGVAAQSGTDNPETVKKKVYLPVIAKPYPLPPFGEPQCVDCPRYFDLMTGSSLRLDNNDHPHIAYGSDHLYHAWNDGSAWHTEVVDSSNGVGEFAALALDSTGSPAISYYDSYNHALKVARSTGSAWVIATIDATNYSGLYSSIAFDSAKHIHVVYIANYGGAYETDYAFWNGSTWSKSLVLQGTDRYVSVALDKQDKPHISYQGAYGGLYYASLSGAAWSSQLVASGSYAGGNNSLAFDSTGKPHISSYNGSAAYLANWNGSNWVSEVASINVDLEQYAPTTLVFDSSDNPIIGLAYIYTYMSYTYDRVGFIRKFNGAWKWGGGYDGKWASLAVDHAGKPHISYGTDSVLDYTLGQEDQLNYASLTAWGTGGGPDSWTNVAVDQGDLVGPGAQLALDSMGRPSIAYYDISNNALKYASAPQGAWITQKVNPPDPNIVPSYGFAIAVDKSGKPHIAYSDVWITRKLYYASWTGTAWVQEPVGDDTGSNSVGDNEKFISLALDASDNPRVSFYDIHNNALEYFEKVGGVWQVKIVDSDSTKTIATGQYQSMALDSLGQPHIAYQGGVTLGNLMYAHWTGSAWAKTTVDSGSSMGYNTAIAVDGQNHPHICYTDYYNEAIKYAHWTGSQWVIQTVTPNLLSDDSRWPRCAIQVGPAPTYTPYISYFDTVVRHLKLAHLVGSSWVIDTVDGNGDAGEFNSMVLFNSNLYFAYYHSGNKDLQYMVWHP